MQGGTDQVESAGESLTLTLPEATAAGVQLLRQGRLVQAEALLQAVVDADPADADALHFLGLLRAQQGRGDDAIVLIRRALDSNPQYADAWNNLGLLLRAVPHYSGALECFDKAVEFGPHLLSAHLNRAQLLRRCGRLSDAADAFRRVLELDPAHADAYQAMAGLLDRLGRVDEAAEAYESWSRLDPQNPVATHLSAAHRPGEWPLRASDDYLRATFDRFAFAFDQNVEALEYRAPQWVIDEVARVYTAQRNLDVLDAGCGTGLCGPLIAPFARRLSGVDLSMAMIDLARQRGPYDELHVAELGEYLKSHWLCYDLIISSDTLEYFGALDAILSAAAGALREGGHLVFTLEQLDEGSKEAEKHLGFFLNPHGRYSHAEAYLRQCIAGAELEVVNLRCETLRLENSVPVAGLILSARRPLACR